MAVRKTDPLLGQAQDEALLRYGQPRETLADMLVSARRTRDQGLSTSKGSLEGILAAIDQAAPEMRKVYTGATGSIESADRLLRADLESLGSAADSFKAAGFRENAGAHQRLAEAGAMALKELSERKIRSAEGAAQQQAGVEGRYAESVGDIGNRAQSLSREEGVFTASRYGQLREARAGRKVEYAKIRSGNRKDRLGRELERDRLTETERHNRETEKGKGKGKGKSRWLTLGEQNTFVGEINKITGLIRAAPKGMSTKQIRAGLHQDFDPKKVNVAMDLVYRKGLSPENVRYVHSQHVPIRGNFPIMPKAKPKTTFLPDMINGLG